MLLIIQIPKVSILSFHLLWLRPLTDVRNKTALDRATPGEPCVALSFRTTGRVQNIWDGSETGLVLLVLNTSTGGPVCPPRSTGSTGSQGSTSSTAFHSCNDFNDSTCSNGSNKFHRFKQFSLVVPVLTAPSVLLVLLVLPIPLVFTAVFLTVGRGKKKNSARKSVKKTEEKATGSNIRRRN